MTFNFKRYEVPETYYSDIDLSIPPGVKYDLYNGGNLVGTLITGYNKTFARFRDGGIYKRHTKVFGRLTNAHNLLNERETTYAYITINRLTFNGLAAIVRFYDDPTSYILNYESFIGYRGSFDQVINIYVNDQPVFSLKNTRKGEFLSCDRDRPMEGTIDMSDHFHRDKIFGFLLAIQLYYNVLHKGHW